MSVRKSYSPEFKAKVVLEIFKEEKSISELSAEYGVHPTQFNRWKAQAIPWRCPGFHFVEFEGGGLLPLRGITGVGNYIEGGTATHVSISRADTPMAWSPLTAGSKQRAFPKAPLAGDSLPAPSKPCLNLWRGRRSHRE